MRSFDRCHFPSREQKEALLHEVRKTDPEYSLAKLIHWFSNRRRFYQESKKEQKDGGEDVLSTLLDPTTSLAREMWPSLSADTLHRLHVMLLEQPHPTVQHKELLAKHFGVERKHVDNFLNWRNACLQTEDKDSDVWREDLQRGPHKHLPAPFYDDDTMDVDKLPDSRPYLHTPSSSTSPEPVESMTPFIRAKLHRPSIDTSSFASREHGSSWPASPASLIESNSPSRSPVLHISSNATHSQANSPLTTSPTSHVQLTPVSPSSSSPSTSPNVHTRSGTKQELRNRTQASVAPVGKPPQAAAPRIPRTLSEFEEAYAPTYARIERFLKDVECNKYAHVGLTPEMLKQIKP
jgi:hypothetical protein